MNDTINQILVSVGRMEGKLDSAIVKFDDHLKMDERIHINLEKRIGYLERWKARIVGISIGIGAVAGTIGSWIHSSGGK